MINLLRIIAKNFNNTQRKYSTVDKELLSIVVTLCEFWSMLLGAELHIHTNHKNILHIRDSAQCRLQWISYVNEYGPKLHYVEGLANVVADTFLRLSRNDTLTSPMVLAGNVGFWHVKKRVQTSDMFVSGQHIANISCNMLVT
jgi:hypothetical protein